MRSLATVLLLAAPITAQVTQRVSVGSGGVPGNGNSDSPSVSADGRYVAFASDASNLVPGDVLGNRDVFVADRFGSTTERVSISTNGREGNHDSRFPFISADGRYVAFYSESTNLVPGDTNGDGDAFVHDRLQHTTERVSVSSTGVQGHSPSFPQLISADGRFVAFVSASTNLVPGDTTQFDDVFVRDRQNGTTEQVSVSTGGEQGNNASYTPRLSADGRFVAFESFATNLAPGGSSPWIHVYLRDRQTGSTELVSRNSAGIPANNGGEVPSLSADGRFVAFESNATNLDPLDPFYGLDVYVRDLHTGVTELASCIPNGRSGNEESSGASISADGRRVQFQSLATNLVPGDTNGHSDVFVRDLTDRTTRRVSVSSEGAQANAASDGSAISENGRYAIFRSDAGNLVDGDVQGWSDAFLHDLDVTGFTSLCGLGSEGVVECPCANPPGGFGRGCGNSSAPEGALLSASGIAYLSMDSLVFTTSEETPSALSIVMQGTGVIAGGVAYGQGVRCVGGILRRLFVAQARGGSITAPDFGAGDPTVSARSAAKGDVIQAGESRWYLVYYRDPVVLGACAASSTFNATQTGRIDWSL